MNKEKNERMLLSLLDTWTWMATHGGDEQIKQSGRRKIIEAFGSIQAAVDFKKRMEAEKSESRKSERQLYE